MTKDQRGILRPQGAACDAGAYEVAPPNLASASAGAAGPTSATVSGQVTPNLTTTKVSVRYGTSTAYGKSSAGTDLGSGGAAASFRIDLTGLKPATIYHLQVVAKNTDGTTSSRDLVLTTPGAMVASVPKGTVKGSVVSIRLACATGAGKCSGAIVLRSRITTKGHTISAATARMALTRVKGRTKTETVGRARYAISAGTFRVIRVALNRLGLRALSALQRLPALLTINGAAHLARRVTFVYTPTPKKAK